MADNVQLVLVIHNHQPVGNFDHVIHEACDKAYLPFLRTLLEFPDVRIGLHTSGCLLEWLEQQRPEYFDLVRLLLERGQLELLGGGMYEPILPVIPPADAHNQLGKLRDYLQQQFGVSASGMWTAERVWEPQLAQTIGRVYQYTLLDDFHFEGNALPQQVAREYFDTEFEGHHLSLLPISQKLRYTLPFRPVAETIGYLRDLASESAAVPLCVFGDDGEKFGVWPDTYKSVYEEGWLRQFFVALTDNLSWIKLLLPSEMLAQRAPAGMAYIPCRSYQEMGEWARVDPDAPADSPPGHWRNFLTKYPEVNDFYRRMCDFSTRLDSAEGSLDGGETLDVIRADLQRSQCNCAYWHGVFGGLYLNYLRAALTTHLLRAEQRFYRETKSGPRIRPLWSGRSDDSTPAPDEGARLSGAGGQPETDFMLEDGQNITAWLDAAHGLCLRRLDYYPSAFCWTDVLSRRREHYHHKIEDLAQQLAAVSNAGAAAGEVGTASIHDRVEVKEAGLDQRLVVDPHQRVSFLTYFSDINDPAWFMTVPKALTDQPRFSSRDFNLRATAEQSTGDLVGLTATVNHAGFSLRKQVALQSSGDLDCSVRLESGTLPTDSGMFWIEFNLTVLTDAAADRYMEVDGQRRPLSLALEQDDAGSVVLVDEWQGRRCELRTARAARLLSYPVYTVSNSEGGFERIYQGTCVMLGFQPDALNEGICITLAITPLEPTSGEGE